MFEPYSTHLAVRGSLGQCNGSETQVGRIALRFLGKFDVGGQHRSAHNGGNLARPGARRSFLVAIQQKSSRDGGFVG